MAIETKDAVAVETAPEAPASRSSDDPKIVDAVQKHLDAFADLEPDDTPAAEEVATTEEKPVEKPAAEAQPKEEEIEVEGETEKPVKEAAPVSGSTLPAAYRRTAKARGWTDEEIDKFHEANSDLSIKTFERMHTSRTQEINEWAELGRKAKQTIAVPAPSPQASAPSVSAASALRPIDVKALAEVYGNEELIQAIAGPVNAAIEALSPIVAGAQKSQESAKQAEQEVLAKVVTDFFSAKDMAPFVEVYGPSDYTVKTQPQKDSFAKVLELADSLIAGAAVQGRRVSTQEALMLAHDVVTSNVKEKVIRDKLQTTMTKRQKGLTLRPTAQGRAAVGGAPRDRQELLSRTEDRLATAFR